MMTNRFATLSDLNDAVKSARAFAEREARREGRKVSCPFIRSRGTTLIALRNGERVIDEPQEWNGTKRDLFTFIGEAIKRNADEVLVQGGYDWSDTFDFYDYEPFATSWEVVVWSTTAAPKLEVETSLPVPMSVAVVLEEVAECGTLDAAESTLRSALPEYFIYRGGNHVAVHAMFGSDRMAMVMDRTGEAR